MTKALTISALLASAVLLGACAQPAAVTAPVSVDAPVYIDAADLSKVTLTSGGALIGRTAGINATDNAILVRR